MNTHSDDFFLIPIPREHLAKGLRLAADLIDGGTTPQIKPAKEEAPPFAEEARWRFRAFTKGELLQLKQALSAKSAAKVMLDLCANSPGGLIGFDDIAKKASVHVDYARGQVGALTKHCKRLFGDPSWPVNAHWGAGGVQKMSYSMLPETAELWKSI